MTFSIRGMVTLRCQHPGCVWDLTLDPLDKRLPDGPFFCSDHEPHPKDCNCLDCWMECE